MKKEKKDKRMSARLQELHRNFMQRASALIKEARKTALRPSRFPPTLARLLYLHFVPSSRYCIMHITRLAGVAVVTPSSGWPERNSATDQKESM